MLKRSGSRSMDLIDSIDSWRRVIRQCRSFTAARLSMCSRFLVFVGAAYGGQSVVRFPASEYVVYMELNVGVETQLQV